jgi:hypothetical protein
MNINNIGLSMSFVLRTYQMSEAELADPRGAGVLRLRGVLA